METSPTHDKPQDSYVGGVDGAGTTTPKPSSSSTAIKTKTVAEVDETGSSKVPSSRSSSYDNGIDYDALYEEEEEMDLSMEAHGSMITHLLSQVKIGMDLTKVVLPTFILERRSLLEMYADYFAHPDLFLK